MREAGHWPAHTHLASPSGAAWCLSQEPRVWQRQAQRRPWVWTPRAAVVICGERKPGCLSRARCTVLRERETPGQRGVRGGQESDAYSTVPSARLLSHAREPFKHYTVPQPPREGRVPFGMFRNARVRFVLIVHTVSRCVRIQVFLTHDLAFFA